MDARPKSAAPAGSTAQTDRGGGRLPAKTGPSGPADDRTIDWSRLDESLTNRAADLALRAFALRVAFGDNVAAQRREKTHEERQAELDEYWSVVSPARNNAIVAEHRWIAAVKAGDSCRCLIEGVASAAALKAAFEARAAILLNHRVCTEAAWATDDLSRPLVELLERNRQLDAKTSAADAGETREQALKRYVAGVKSSSDEAVAELEENLQPHDSVAGRVDRLLRCSQWWDVRGALRDLSPSECVNLFRSLLVTTAAYDSSRDALAKVVVLRKSGRAIQRAIQSLGYIVGLTQVQSDAFAVLLEILCADGESEQRHHQKPNAVRVFAIDLIVSALLPHWKSKADAIRMFEKEPRSTGIAELATAALDETVTSGHVRDALKRWKRDKSNRLVV